MANVDEWFTVIATREAVGVTAEATEHSHPHPGVRYLPLADAPAMMVIRAWPRTPTHPATRAFLDHLRDDRRPPAGRPAPPPLPR